MTCYACGHELRMEGDKGWCAHCGWWVDKPGEPRVGDGVEEEVALLEGMYGFESGSVFPVKEGKGK